MSAMEDCRDYLRTGRCKYGTSCKYNHPSNLQACGGVKPSNPNEPLFPIRPDEPICQYYMKHGTCKFYHACKFNHPPTNSIQIINGNSLQQITAGGPARQVNPSPQLVMNSVGSDSNGVLLQFLPQRPDEPDCIYFLKNGRCKYGATCRYHHPVQNRQTVEPNLRRLPVQYTTQMVQAYPSQTGRMVMSSDSIPMSCINIDGSSGYQLIPGADGTFCVPTNSSVVATEQGSSTSSLASSFETSLDNIGDAQWNRSKRSGSGGSLNALQQHQQQRNFIPHSVSEGNMAQQRRTRTDSYSTSSDHSSQHLFDAASAPPGMLRNGSASSWTQRTQGTQYFVRQDPSQQFIGGRPPSMPSSLQRHNIRRHTQRSDREGDPGMNMMMSSLMNLLDTPEEAASAGSFSEEDYRHQVTDHYQVQLQTDPSIYERNPMVTSSFDNQPPQQQVYRHTEDQNYVESDMFAKLSLQDHHMSSNQLSPSETWSPSWQESDNQDKVPTHPMAVMLHHQPQAPGPSRSSHDTDVGLYLP